MAQVKLCTMAPWAKAKQQERPSTYVLRLGCWERYVRVKCVFSFLGVGAGPSTFNRVLVVVCTIHFLSARAQFRHWNDRR